LAWIHPGESHPEQCGHGSSRESRGERCEDRKGFPRWGKSLSFAGTYLCPGLKTFVTLKKWRSCWLLEVAADARHRV